MNAYYNDFDIKKHSGIDDKCISVICAIMKFFSNRYFIGALKVSIIVVALFGFIATVGMVDEGTLGFFSGTAICFIISAVEFVLVGSMVKKARR